MQNTKIRQLEDRILALRAERDAIDRRLYGREHPATGQGAMDLADERYKLSLKISRLTEKKDALRKKKSGRGVAMYEGPLFYTADITNYMRCGGTVAAVRV